MSTLPRLAKLTRPRSDGLLARERLFAVLDQAETRPVWWVSGPPGAGKTSLISSYLDARQRGGIWYQVDRGDNDPATFFHYLGTAAAQCIGRRSGPLPLFSDDVASDISGFSRRFFRALFASLAQGSVIVLDNYQEVDDRSALHGVLKESLEEIPETIRVIGISRSEPPAEFSRARAAQKMAFLGWDSLRLTREETAAIAHDRSLDESMLATLQTQTGGWAAGVVLMLERLRHTGQVRDLAQSENLETVFDYFADQLFDATDKSTREMLLRMAYLPRLTARTAEIITGQAEAGTLLATLAKRNLFTDRRYGEETSFQFHALFRSFLQDKARQQLGVAEHRKIAHSAAALLESTGMTEDAFELYLESAAWGPAERLILSTADTLIHQGRRHTLRRWISALPLEHTQSRPWLLYWLGQSLSGSDKVRAIQTLTMAYEEFSGGDDVNGQFATASSIVECIYVDPRSLLGLDLWIERMEAHYKDPRLETSNERSELGVANLGRALLARRPTAPFTHEIMAPMLQFIRDGSTPNVMACSGTILLLYCWLRGDSETSEEIVRRVEAVLSDPRLSPARLRYFQFHRAVQAGRMLQFGLAEDLLRQGMALDDESRTSPVAVEFLCARAAIKNMEGRYGEAHQLLGKVSAPDLNLIRASMRPSYYYVSAQCAAVSGDYAEVQKHIDGFLSYSQVGAQMQHLMLVPYMAQLYATIGQPEKGRELIESVRAQTLDAQSPWLAGRMAWAETYCHLLEGDSEKSVHKLAEALPKLKLSQYIFWARFPGKRYAELFSLALRHNVEPQYVRSLIKNLNIKASSPDIDAWPWALRIHALGSLKLWLEDQPIDSSGKARHKVLDLLKSLIALGGLQVARTDLADALWPDADGDTALKNLEVTLHRLRKQLRNDDLILMQDGKLSFDRQQSFLDIWAFDLRVRQFLECRPETATYADLGRRALDLYAGHLLAAERELPVFLKTREAFRQKWLAVVIALGQHHESLGLWPEAVAVYSRALAIDSEASLLRQRLVHCQDRIGAATARTRLGENSPV
jgi:LuxR family transcriptional regulator, maltose regulon positive regulatory protein